MAVLLQKRTRTKGEVVKKKGVDGLCELLTGCRRELSLLVDDDASNLFFYSPERKKQWRDWLPECWNRLFQGRQ